MRIFFLVLLTFCACSETPTVQNSAYEDFIAQFQLAHPNFFFWELRNKVNMNIPKISSYPEWPEQFASTKLSIDPKDGSYNKLMKATDLDSFICPYEPVNFCHTRRATYTRFEHHYRFELAKDVDLVCYGIADLSNEIYLATYSKKTKKQIAKILVQAREWNVMRVTSYLQPNYELQVRVTHEHQGDYADLVEAYLPDTISENHKKEYSLVKETRTTYKITPEGKFEVIKTTKPKTYLSKRFYRYPYQFKDDREIIRSFKDSSIDIEWISSFTGFSEEEIKKMLNN